MRRFVLLLSTIVRRWPVWVLAAVVVVSAGLGSFVPQMRVSTGNEGFSPDNAELNALIRASDLFSDSAETVVQVVVRSEAGDAIGADGLAAVLAVEDAVLASPAADVLSAQEGRPPIVDYLAPVRQALAVEGIDPASLDDDAIGALYTDVLAQMPPEQAEFLTALLADGSDPAGARASAGLMLVFLDTTGLGAAEFGGDFEAIAALQQDVVDAVAAATVPAGVEVEAFGFELLFADDGSFEQEVGRLFGAAFVIILVILAFVFFVRPDARKGGRMTLGRSARRTAADVGLTLATILLSITWMQGIGVLLGPDYLGLIGEFTPPTQIVPILLIGLGVDYSIHLTSRYREELGHDRTPTEAAGIAAHTVGIALVLATMTTAVGFLTNVTNPLPALRDFGILAAVGIVSAFVLMLTLVPSVRLLVDRRAQRKGRLAGPALGTTSDRLLPRVISRTAVLAQRFAVATLSVTLVFGVLGAWGLTRLSTEFSFTDFVPEDDPLLATFERLQDDFGGGFGESTQVLLDGDLGTPEAHNALVASLDRIADTPDVVRFNGAAAVDSVVAVLAEVTLPGPDGQVALPELAEAVSAAGLQPDLTVAADADVAGIYTRLLAEAPVRAGRVLRATEDGFASRIEIRTSAGEARAPQLAEDLRADLEPLTAVGVEATATSDFIVGAVIVRELQESQVVSLVITLAAAMALLVATFWIQARRPALGAITIFPVVLVVLWTFGMMALTGIPFGPITAILSALAIGIGVPFTIHITQRFQEDRRRFEDPAHAIASTVRHTGGALAGSALTTIAGFGILTTSSLTPFRQMGQVTAYAIGFAFVAAVLVLPSMLVLWDRWHRRRGEAPLEGTAPLDIPLVLEDVEHSPAD